MTIYQKGQWHQILHCTLLINSFEKNTVQLRLKREKTQRNTGHQHRPSPTTPRGKLTHKIPEFDAKQSESVAFYPLKAANSLHFLCHRGTRSRGHSIR